MFRGLIGFQVVYWHQLLKNCISFHVHSMFCFLMQENTKEYGQATFIASEKTSGIGEKERQAIELMENLSRNGFEKLMMENELDALVTPGTGAIPVLAIGGHPGITVPAGYDSDGMPFGICFGGTKGTEPKLIEIAYAFEQGTLTRRPPFSKSFEMNNEVLFGSV